MKRNSTLMALMMLTAIGCARAAEPGKPEYTIARTDVAPPIDATEKAGDWESVWNDPRWAGAQTLTVENFHTSSTLTRPKAQARVLFDDDAIYVIWRVEDTHVTSVINEYNGPVSRDSCVEFFFEPHPARYFNIEINAGGTLLFRHNQTQPDGSYKREVVNEVIARDIVISHSLPPVIAPPIESNVTWFIAYKVPFDMLEKLAGPLRPVAGKTWRANFYKILGDPKNPHAHWGTWSPIVILSFHQPQHFAPLHFESNR